MIHSIGDSRPVLGEGAFVAWNAEVAGSVRLGARASVWFSATIRADLDGVDIGEETNLQDNAVIHVDGGQPCRIGARCVIGHGAVIHCSEIGDECLIGMGAIVMGGAVIGEGSVVGAGALVTEGKVFPPGSLIVGSPARALGKVGDEDRARIREGAAHYVALAARVRDEYREM